MRTPKLHQIVVIFVFLLTVGPLAAQATFQTAEMHLFGTSIPVGGAATLTRTADEVWARVATSGLSKKTAFSVWFIVFNNPDQCVDGCGSDDLDDPLVAASVFNAGGFVTGTDGTANFTTHVKTGDLPAGLFVPRGAGILAGNGLGAEIHIALRAHMGINVGMVAPQISTTEGPLGSNEQAAAFPAP